MSLPREQICRGCSLAVQPGYPKCPRCKMPLPAVEAPLAQATKSSQSRGGGTAIADDRNATPFILAGALLLVAAVAVIAVVATGDKEAATPEDLGREDVASPVAQNASANAAAGPEIGITTQPGEPNDAERRALALTDLDEALSDARLWATVGVLPEAESTISVVSSACEQDDMRPALEAAGPPLREVGFASIQCVAKHGALVFELDL